MDDTQLSKKERIALKHEEERKKVENASRMRKLRNYGLIAIVLALVGWGAWWVISESSKPLPGIAIDDLGRDHVTDISEVTYNSNPPTSGNHFALWAKRGVYKNVVSDGYLIHSLEHGYVVLSYNCSDLKKSGDEAKLLRDETLQNLAAAPVGNMAPFTPDNPPPNAVTLPENFSSSECQKLVSELSAYLDGYDRIVIAPRPGLDTKIALTAWNRVEKMDTVDDAKIRAFLDVFHNKGPEQTIE